MAEDSADKGDLQGMHDAEEDMHRMELELSQHSEDYDTKLSIEEQEELCEGPQEPSWEPPEGGCCDMSLEQYDPTLANGIPQDGSLCEVPAEERMEQEINDLALAEPEPPEEMDARH